MRSWERTVSRRVCLQAVLLQGWRAMRMLMVLDLGCVGSQLCLCCPSCTIRACICRPLDLETFGQLLWFGWCSSLVVLDFIFFCVWWPSEALLERYNYMGLNCSCQVLLVCTVASSSLSLLSGKALGKILERKVSLNSMREGQRLLKDLTPLS